MLEQNNESYPLSFQVDTWRSYHSYLEVKHKTKKEREKKRNHNVYKTVLTFVLKL